MLGRAAVAHSGVKVSSRILDRYLLRGEDIVVANRAHWAKLAEPVLTALLAFVLVSWLSATLERSTGSPALWLYWGWLGLVARAVWRLLEWRNEWFVATDKRLLMTYGLITHRVAMMPLRKVTDMNYGRSIVGRFVGYGTFTLESAGQDQAMREINWVPDPDDTYRSICDIIFVPTNRDEDDELPEDEDGAEEDAQAYDLLPGPAWDQAGQGAPGQDALPDEDLDEHLDEDADRDLRDGPDRHGHGMPERDGDGMPGRDGDGMPERDGDGMPGRDGDGGPGEVADQDDGPGWEVSDSGDSAYMPVTVRPGTRRAPGPPHDDDPTGPLPPL